MISSSGVSTSSTEFKEDDGATEAVVVLNAAISEMTWQNVGQVGIVGTAGAGAMTRQKPKQSVDVSEWLLSVMMSSATKASAIGS